MAPCGGVAAQPDAATLTPPAFPPQIVVHREGGQPSDTGAAFVLGDAGMVLARVASVGTGMGEVELRTAGGAYVPGEVHGYELWTGVLLARAPDSLGTGPAVDWDYGPEYGDPVWIVGCPGAGPTEWRSAVVSDPATYGGTTGATMYWPLGVFEIDVPFDASLRGAPVVDRRGMVVGQYVGGVHYYPELSRVVLMSVLRPAIDEVTEVAGEVLHGRAGFRTRAIRHTDAAGTQTGGECRIQRVETGSPAAVAGLRDGDVLLSVNGGPPPQFLDFIDFTGRCRPGDAMALVVERDGEPVEIRFSLAVDPTLKLRRVREEAERDGTADPVLW